MLGTISELPAETSAEALRDSFISMKKVVDLSYMVYTKERIRRKPCLEDLQTRPVDPTLGQTTGGIFLKTRNGSPSGLWTPFGEWRCWGVIPGPYMYQRGGLGRFFKLIDVIRSFELESEYERRRNDDKEGVINIYAVRGLNRGIYERLPDPELRNKRSYIKPESVRFLWEEFFDEMYGEAVR